MNKKKEVSKGLRSLLSNIERTNNPEERSQLVKELTNNTNNIPIESIEVNPFQPRSEFDESALQELAKSIAHSGLIQPITVRSVGGNKYQLISGERRLRASKLAGLKEIPAYIRVANDQEMLEMALVENIQRADLNALEIAISYQRLMEECNLTHEAMAERIGKDRSTITNYVRLLKLPATIQSGIKENKITMGHARALAGIDNIAFQLQLFNQVVNQQLSVRALEQLIKSTTTHSITKKTNITDKAVQIELQNLTQKLKRSLGTNTVIKRNNNGLGTIVIHFESDSELNRIIAHLTAES